MKITINSEPVELSDQEAKDGLAYQQIVDRADSGRSKQALHTITYFARGEGDQQRSGTICPGQRLIPCEGMHIAAMVTDNA